VNSIAERRPSRVYDNTIILIVLMGWFGLMLPSACFINTALASQAAGGVCHEHNSQPPSAKVRAGHDCDSQPCFEAQTQAEAFFLFNKQSSPDLPAAALILLWAAYFFNFRFLPQPNFRKPGPLPGRQISLIYRFCSLLN